MGLYLLAGGYLTYGVEPRHFLFMTAEGNQGPAGDALLNRRQL